MKFAQTLVTTTGTLPEADVAALRNAGFSDQQVIEIISAISAILFTNMVNGLTTRWSTSRKPINPSRSAGFTAPDR